MKFITWVLSFFGPSKRNPEVEESIKNLLKAVKGMS